LITDGTRSALISQESVEARGITAGTAAVARCVFALLSAAMLALLSRANPVGVSLGRLVLAYHIRYLDRLRPA
jgi:hypothetical protein